MEKKYDYESRSFLFAKNLILLSNKLSLSTANKVLIQQVIRSGTSIGANYREGNEAQSDKDRKYKYNIVRKEAKETCYWLELLKETNKLGTGEIDYLIDEGHQLLKIIIAINRNLSKS